MVWHYSDIMHKKSKAQLQDYLKDLTAMGDTSSEQMEPDQDGHQGETTETASSPPKKRLSLPNLSPPAIANPHWEPGSDSLSSLGPGDQQSTITAPLNGRDQYLAEEDQTQGHVRSKRWLWLGGILVLLVGGTALTLPRALEMVNGWRQEATCGPTSRNNIKIRKCCVWPY
ncbi:hypothetical protein [Synechocystis salina]|uniref:hypothetical protein n=1 Tax=Synechocystis salina TaxID=945780 RepID=UPI001D1505C6|nr:hypothetical protein [Synechocystis salina]